MNASDTNPIWVGDDVVFISDRNDGAANLFIYSSKTKEVRQLTKETCDHVARLNLPGAIQSLNVSNAAAVALYIARSRAGTN